MIHLLRAMNGYLINLNYLLIGMSFSFVVENMIPENNLNEIIAVITAKYAFILAKEITYNQK